MARIITWDKFLVKTLSIDKKGIVTKIIYDILYLATEFKNKECGMFSEDQSNSERRKFPRVDFREPIKFQTPSSSANGGCLGRDLSEGGLRINFESFVKPNTAMGFELRLAPAQETVSLEGRVAWAYQVPLSDRYQLGIEFIGANEEHQKDIRKYIISNQLT
jgi:c-di-GMP-binding flagellar brake protein YcgR